MRTDIKCTFIGLCHTTISQDTFFDSLSVLCADPIIAMVRIDEDDQTPLYMVVAAQRCTKVYYMEGYKWVQKQSHDYNTTERAILAMRDGDHQFCICASPNKNDGYDHALAHGTDLDNVLTYTRFGEMGFVW
jgi:hypothetical protein